MKSHLAALTFLGILAIGSARAQVRTDSLESRLETASGTERVSVLSGLVAAYERRDPPRSVAYGREALTLLRAHPDSGSEIEILYAKGRAHLWIGEYDSAMVHADRIENLANREGSEQGLAQAANLRGTTFSLQGRLPEALGPFADALGHWERLGDARGTANVLNNLGIVHMRLGNYDEALDHYLRALSAWEEIGDPAGLARALNNTGNLQLDLGKPREAEDFYSRALGIREQAGDSAGVATVLNNLGLIRMQLDDPDTALGYYSRALAIWDGVGDRNNVGRVLINLAEVHARKGNYERSLATGERALEIKQTIGDRRGTAIALNVIGMAHRSLGNDSEALDHLERSLSLAEDVGERRLARDTYEALSDIHASRGDYADALAAYRSYKAANDSLFNQESQARIDELETRYETAEQRRQIELLERRQEIQEIWRFALGGGLLLVVLIAFLIYSRYRLKSRAHATLEQAHDQLRAMQAQLVHAEKMASLGQLTAGIAHEIKNPLNFVTNFAESNAELVDEQREELSESRDRTVGDVMEGLEDLLGDLGQNSAMIARHGRRADGIVHAMMQHASGGTGNRVPTDLNTLVSEHVDLAYHGKRARLRDLRVEIERDLGPDVGKVDIVQSEIGRVVLNLLDNALDAVHERSQQEPGFSAKVRITTRRSGSAVEIRVADNGPGIGDDASGKVFEPFFTTKPSGSGTGLGLSLSFDIVAQGHGGTLAVEPTEGGGATFVVRLPVSRA